MVPIRLPWRSTSLWKPILIGSFDFNKFTLNLNDEPYWSVNHCHLTNWLCQTFFALLSTVIVPCIISTKQNKVRPFIESDLRMHTQVFDDCQPETDASISPRRRRVELLEGLEESADFRLGHSDTRVNAVELQLVRVRVLVSLGVKACHFQCHKPFLNDVVSET